MKLTNAEKKMKTIIMFLFAAILMACASKHSKESHVGTSEVVEGLFWEVYETYSGGVYAGSSYSYYLTDSVNFRTFVISKNHDDELVKREFRNDTVFVFKVGNAYASKEDTLEIREFSIRELVNNARWD